MYNTSDPPRVFSSIEASLLYNPKLYNLSTSFKFYNIDLNSGKYILGIHYLTNNYVRKIPLYLSGQLLEDIVDTELENGKIERVSGNNVLIINKDRVINYYKKIKLLRIRNNSKGISSTDNPNIGVIDFETYQSRDGRVRIYGGGFKSFVDK